MKKGTEPLLCNTRVSTMSERTCQNTHIRTQKHCIRQYSFSSLNSLHSGYNICSIEQAIFDLINGYVTLYWLPGKEEKRESNKVDEQSELENQFNGITLHHTQGTSYIIAQLQCIIAMR